MENSESNILNNIEQLSLYRDELNFAEFPLATLSDRAPKDQKTLSFKDTIFDRSLGKSITRTLTISASDEYGLPTPLDDEIILGLIQLTNRNKFKDRKVYFTRYELIQILGWKDNGISYARITDSLKRWLGVTLYYDKAWWSKENQCWVNENFHILDQVSIYDRDTAKNNKKDDPNQRLSSFVWNQVVFDSFQAGYLKKIDMKLYTSLESSISKRIYRFLDKRFHHKKNLEFKLEEFAFEHIGLSRNYHTGEIKRRLNSAIQELEKAGFLKALNQADRFIKQSKGNWIVTFQAAEKSTRLAEPEYNQIQSKELDQLVSRGVTKTTAQNLILKHSAEKIQQKIEVFDWLIENNDKRISTNPGGYLYKSIEEDYALPNGFESQQEKLEKIAVKQKTEVQKQKKEQTRKNQELEKSQSERALLDAYWNSMSDSEQVEFEKEAVKNSESFHVDQYVKGKRTMGSLFKTVRQLIIDNHIKRKMGEGS